MPTSSTSASRTPAATARAGRWPTAACRSAGAEELERSPDVALAWTLRSSPHYYRRTELTDVMVATSPFSDADAAKRVVGADKPLKAAGIPARQGLAEVAGKMRTVVTQPMVKGEVSTRLTPLLDEPYRRDCRACNAVHAWESSFRLSALYAGLELEPGTSPPVLRRIPGWPRRTAGPGRGPAGRAGASAAHPQLPALSGAGDSQGRGRLSGRPGGRDQEALAGRRRRGRRRGRGALVAGGAGHRVRPGPGPAAGWLRPAAAGPGPAS